MKLLQPNIKKVQEKTSNNNNMKFLQTNIKKEKIKKL